MCSSQQFVEQLSGLKVYLGEPAELRCRLEPWVTGTSPESGTTINWYHFETVLTPELQDRVGIKTECNEGLCTLRIEKTSRRFGGVYKCEAKNKFGVCTTSCRLLIDRKTALTSAYLSTTMQKYPLNVDSKYFSLSLTLDLLFTVL